MNTDKMLLEEVRSNVLPLLKEQGVELVDLLLIKEKGRPLLRFLVDTSDGITIDECARLNQQIGRVLEEQNIVQEGYILEVSSPGLDRPLKSDRDFQRNLGKLVKAALHQPLNKQNVWVGYLDGVEKEEIVIRTEQGETLRIARRDIAWVKLAI